MFDLHTDAMLDFVTAHPVIEGDEHGSRYVIRSVVDADARTCDARIEVLRTDAGEPFAEQHLQFFHSDDQVRAALDEAGFALAGIVDEYSPTPAGTATLRATWIARRRS